MEKEEEQTMLIIKTVDGKRMVYTEDGKLIKHLFLTRETQDQHLANTGLCEVLIRIWAKCE